MYKKLLILLIICMILTSIFTGCSKDKNIGNSDSNNSLKTGNNKKILL